VTASVRSSRAPLEAEHVAGVVVAGPPDVKPWRANRTLAEATPSHALKRALQRLVERAGADAGGQSASLTR
jgi:hypothetical protein